MPRSALPGIAGHAREVEYVAGGGAIRVIKHVAGNPPPRVGALVARFLTPGLDADLIGVKFRVAAFESPQRPMVIAKVRLLVLPERVDLNACFQFKVVVSATSHRVKRHKR